MRTTVFRWQLAEHERVLRSDPGRFSALIGQRGEQSTLTITDFQRWTYRDLAEEFAGAATGALSFGLEWWDIATAHPEWNVGASGAGAAFLDSPSYAPGRTLDGCEPVSIEVDGAEYLGISVHHIGQMTAAATISRGLWLITCVPTAQFKASDLKFRFLEH